MAPKFYPSSFNTARVVFLKYSVFTRIFTTLIFTVNMIYFVTVAGLNPLQMVLIGTTLEISIFVFEVPTGVVADTISRKRSIIIGTFLMGAGFILQALVTTFSLILLAQVLWGVGYTFTSGALQAWISDEVGEEPAASLFIKATQLEQAGGFFAIGISVLAAIYFEIWLPMLLGGIGFVLMGFWLIRSMRESNFRPVENKDAKWSGGFSSMAATIRNGMTALKLRPLLIRILLAGFFFGFYSEGLDRLWVPHLIERFQLPEQGNAIMIGWIGALQAFSLIITFFAAGAIHHYMQKSGENRNIARLLTLFSALLVGSVLFLALSQHILLAFIALIVISVIREVISPLYTAWVNYRLQSESRATILSLSSLVDAFGQISGGPLIGIIANSSSIQNGLVGSAIFLSPVIVLLMMTPNKEPRFEPEAVSDR